MELKIQPVMKNTASPAAVRNGIIFKPFQEFPVWITAIMNEAITVVMIVDKRENVKKSWEEIPGGCGERNSMPPVGRPSGFCSNIPAQITFVMLIN